MKIEDFKGANNAISENDIETILAKRYGENANEFWLSHASDKFPAVSILVKGDLATLNYYSTDQDPGMISIGGKLNLKPDGSTIFYINTTEKQPIPNGMIVPFSLALNAAKEFSENAKPPTCIEWFVL